VPPIPVQIKMNLGSSTDRENKGHGEASEYPIPFALYHKTRSKYQMNVSFKTSKNVIGSIIIKKKKPLLNSRAARFPDIFIDIENSNYLCADRLGDFNTHRCGRRGENC